jgi:hypothetical protein
MVSRHFTHFSKTLDMEEKTRRRRVKGEVRNQKEVEVMGIEGFTDHNLTKTSQQSNVDEERSR